MHPSMRLLTLERSSLKGPRPLYICLNCRHETPTHARPIIQQIRPNSNSAPLTERLRRKLWGTENPPGMKDPYGGKGVFERKWGQGESNAGGQVDARRAEEESEYGEGEENLAPPDEYVPATTWDDLKRIGHLGEWWNYPANGADGYNRFISSKRVYGTAVDTAAHQATIEISLLRKLNKPAVNACRVLEHEKTIRKLVQSCMIKPDATNWDTAIVFRNKRAKNVLLYVFEQIGDLGKEGVEGEQPVTSAEKQKQQRARDVGFAKDAVDEFKKLSFEDPAIRFAFMKRFSQLSGHLIPDPLVHSASTVNDAVDYVRNVLSPKKKLANRLNARESIRKLPNITVLNSKYTKGDMDEKMGRGKVIRAVLQERGLA